MRTSAAPHKLSLHYANRSHPGAGKPKKLRQAKPTAWHRSSCTAITPGIHTGNHQLHGQTCTISQSAHTHTGTAPAAHQQATARNSIGDTDAQQSCLRLDVTPRSSARPRWAWGLTLATRATCLLRPSASPSQPCLRPQRNSQHRSRLSSRTSRTSRS